MPGFEEITRHSDPDPTENPWVNGPPAPETVTIAAYDPAWPHRYAALATGIRAALGEAALNVEHVGSTSVEGLAAKDVIDIDLTVADPTDEGAYVPALERLGYRLTVREPSFHEHRCLRLAAPRVNLHVFGPGCPELVRHRMFRDWLRAHPEDRARYERAKRSAVPGGGTVMDYNARKERVVREIYDRLFRAAGMLPGGTDMRYRALGDGRLSLTVSDLCLGTMNFGYRTDERTAFNILDRFADAGGTFLDTANNYGQWHGEAGESERVLGRWLAARPAGDDMVVATKVGARTMKPGDPSREHWQGLGRDQIRADALTSRRQLGRDRLDLYYAHIDDRTTPQAETVDALAELAESGAVGLLGCSNTALWRIERARGIAGGAGRPAYSCVQQRHSYLLPLPGPRQHNLVTEELIDYAEAENLALLAYSPLLGGVYPRGARPSGEYAHAANDERLAVLAEVAGELNATTSQVVLAWLLASRPSVLPIIGASSVAQLDELLGALAVTLDDETMARLDAAGRRTG